MRPIVINAVDLCKDIAYYATMSPGTAPVTYDDLERRIENAYERSMAGDQFGYSVSSEWPHKCFGFRVEVKDDKVYIVRYTGITKC